jgi:hypothetical protein
MMERAAKATGLKQKSIHTCSGTPAASPWPIQVTIPAPYKPISGIGTSSIPPAAHLREAHPARAGAHTESVAVWRAYFPGYRVRQAVHGERVRQLVPCSLRRGGTAPLHCSRAAQGWCDARRGERRYRSRADGAVRLGECGRGYYLHQAGQPEETSRAGGQKITPTHVSRRSAYEPKGTKSASGNGTKRQVCEGLR